jgi:hypothetical protein
MEFKNMKPLLAFIQKLITSVFTIAFMSPIQLAMQWTRILGLTKLAIIMC